MSSFGEDLKRERELRQITLREVSEATKINLRYLDALERNDFRHLPGGVFNKGFVRAYAQYIGIDPEAMVNAYLLEERAQQQARGEHLSPDVFRPASTPANGGEPGSEGETARDSAGRRRNVAIAGAAAALVLLLLLAWALLSWLSPGEVEEGPAAVPGPAERPAESGTLEIAPEPASPPEPSPAQAVETESTTAAVEDLADAVETPVAETVESADTQSSEGIEAKVVLRRATAGRVNCDNRRVEILDGIAPGTELEFRCESFLLIDAQDGGAVLLGWARRRRRRSGRTASR